MSARLVCRILPWITVAIFLVGILVRTRGWVKGRRPELTLFPSGGSPAGGWKIILREILIFESLLRCNRSLWGGTLFFHAGLLLILAGHAQVLSDFLWALQWLGLTPAEADSIGRLVGSTAGILVMIFGFFLLARRVTVQSAREISSLEDYLVLGLLLAVIVSGNALRFSADFDLDQVRTFFRGFLQLPSPPVPSDPLFLVHFTLAQLLLISVPFTKFLHIPGVFLAKSLLVSR